MNDVRDKIIIALDYSNFEEVQNLILKLGSDLKFVKVGMELFYKEGPIVVKKLKEMGFKVFLDLKLHDIPNTVLSASKVLLNLEVDILNLHALGGKTMMNQVAKYRDDIKSNAFLIGVTHLTSTSEKVLKEELNISNQIEEDVIRLAENVKVSGLDGVVCSALEINSIRSKLGNDFLLVTPGVRLDSKNSHDQQRISTPKEAITWGANHIVVGREVTKSKDPRSTFLKIIDEIS